jgi:hypothetical protein
VELETWVPYRWQNVLKGFDQGASEGVEGREKAVIAVHLDRAGGKLLGGKMVS